MVISQSFTVASPPERVFDYMVDPANLRSWQASKTRVEPLTDGPPRQGYRVREWTKRPGGEFEQVVEFRRVGRAHPGAEARNPGSALRGVRGVHGFVAARQVVGS